MPRTRSPKLRLVALTFALITGAVALCAVNAQAADTSCDITTGASCLWGEGCDCDHDGYVRDTGKAKKYCHFSKCPLDQNDNDASKLGKASGDNGDGDGWTKDYDCDDADPCIGQTCGASTCAVVVDDDNDGFDSTQDCDDADANVYPGAAIACCSCEVLTSAAKTAQFSCQTGCPLSKPAADAGGQDTANPDTANADTANADTASADIATGSLVNLPADARVGGGTWVRPAPPPPGCNASHGNSSPQSGDGPALLLGSLLLWALWRALGVGGKRRRAGMVAVALLVAAASMGGCATVKPWQRGRLAHRGMIFGAEAAESTLEQHTLQYREGAGGGYGGGGGGCGCN